MNISATIDRLREECAAQRAQLFLWSPVFLSLGIGFYFTLPGEPPLWPAVICVGGLFLVLVLLRKYPRGFIPVLLVFLIAAGFLSAQLRTLTVYTPVLQRDIGPVDVTGTVISAEQLDGSKGQRLLLGDLVIERILPQDTPVEARLSIRRAENFRVGERVKVLAKLNPPSPPVAPGAFDFQRYMYFQRIGAVGFMYKKLETISTPDGDFSDKIENLRNIVAQRVHAVIGPAEAPMSIAFMTGQRAAISDNDNLAMQNSGLAHLISISGIHIALFSAFVFFTARLLMACIPGMALKQPIKKYSSVLALAAATFYTVLAGGGIPTDRSLIMVGIAYVAIMLDRSPLSLRLIAFAALALLLAAPESLLTASFQMSFSAVALLIIVFEWLQPWLTQWHRQAGFFKRAGLYLAVSCATTIIATVATAPFSFFHFQQMAVYSLPSNIIAAPLTTFIIMPAIVTALFLMPLHLEFIPLKILGLGMKLLLLTAHDIAALPMAVLRVAAWPLDALVVMLCGAVFLCLWKGQLRFLGFLPVIIALCMIHGAKNPDVLMSRDFEVAAYRSEDSNLHVSGRRKDKFSVESWERLFGLEKGSASDWPKEGRDGDMICDGNACRLELKNYKISFLKTPRALAEECAWANAVLSFEVIEDSARRVICGALPVHDKLDGFRSGAEALWLSPSGLTVKTAEGERGQRLWSGLNDRFSGKSASSQQAGPGF